VRRSLLLAFVVLSLVLPLGSVASARESQDRTGLLVTFMGWGKLHRGMTAREAERTGMVSTTFDHCSPGHPLTKPYRSRGYLVWNATKKPWKVSQIVVTGPSDHTTKGIHPGSTLAELRQAYPLLSKVHDSSYLTGQEQPGRKDFHVAIVKRRYGALTFEWDWGTTPKPGTPLDMIIVSRKPALFAGC